MLGERGWLGHALLTDGEDCPDDSWAELGGRCYKVVGSSDFHTCLTDNCAEYGASLACVRDSKTNAWLVSNVLNNTSDGAWLGYTDGSTEDAWEWVAAGCDSDYWGFSSWEPNDSGGCEDCAHFWCGERGRSLSLSLSCRARHHRLSSPSRALSARTPQGRRE